MHFKDYKEWEKYINTVMAKTPPKTLISCLSAFNGFAIYKSSMFLNCSYSSVINLEYMPIDILEKERKTRDIPMNSYEGFIRQLFWREYQHLCYLYVDFSGNYFGNN